MAAVPPIRPARHQARLIPAPAAAPSSTRYSAAAPSSSRIPPPRPLATSKAPLYARSKVPRASLYVTSNASAHLYVRSKAPPQQQFYTTSKAPLYVRSKAPPPPATSRVALPPPPAAFSRTPAPSTSGFTITVRRTCVACGDMVYDHASVPFVKTQPSLETWSRLLTRNDCEALDLMQKVRKQQRPVLCRTHFAPSNFIGDQLKYGATPLRPKPRIVWVNRQGDVVKVKQVYQKPTQYRIVRPVGVAASSSFVTAPVKVESVNESVLRLLNGASAEMAIMEAAAYEECESESQHEHASPGTSSAAGADCVAKTEKETGECAADKPPPCSNTSYSANAAGSYSATGGGVAPSPSSSLFQVHQVGEELELCKQEDNDIGSAYFIGSNTTVAHEEEQAEDGFELRVILDPSEIPRRPRGRPRKRPLSPRRAQQQPPQKKRAVHVEEPPQPPEPAIDFTSTQIILSATDTATQVKMEEPDADEVDSSVQHSDPHRVSISSERTGTASPAGGSPHGSYTHHSRKTRHEPEEPSPSPDDIFYGMENGMDDGERPAFYYDSASGEPKARRGRGRPKKVVAPRESRQLGFGEARILKKAYATGLAEYSLVNPHVAKTILSNLREEVNDMRGSGEAPLSEDEDEAERELPLFGPTIPEEEEEEVTGQKEGEEATVKQEPLDEVEEEQEESAVAERSTSAASIGRGEEREETAEREEGEERADCSPAATSEDTTTVASTVTDQLPPGVEISKITGKIKKKYNVNKKFILPTKTTSGRAIKLRNLEFDPSKDPGLKRKKEKISKNKKGLHPSGEESERQKHQSLDDQLPEHWRNVASKVAREKKKKGAEKEPEDKAEKTRITAEEQEVLKRQLRDFRPDGSYIPDQDVQAEEHGYANRPRCSAPSVATSKSGEKIRKKHVRQEPALVESFRCAMCSKKVHDQQYALKEHAREHACDTLGCPYEGCRFRAQTRGRISYHTTNSHREWRMAIDLCENDQELATLLFRLVQQCFPRARNLPLEKGVACKLCEALVAPSYYSLHEHVLTHLPSRPLSCSICIFDAYNHTQMYQHIERTHCGGRVVSKIDAALRALIRKMFLTAYPILEGCDFTNDAEVRKAAGIEGDFVKEEPQWDMEEDLYFPPADPVLTGNDDISIAGAGAGGDYPEGLPAPRHVPDSEIRELRQGLMAFHGFENDHSYCPKA